MVKMAKENNNTIILLAILAVILAFIALVSVFYSVAIYTGITGKATAIGAANLTIITEAAINISNSSVEWGQGRVSVDAAAAVLNTSSGTVSGGNWSAVKVGLLVQNNGNINVTLDLSSSSGNGTIFLGNSSSYVGYEWNISNYKAGACGSPGFGRNVFSPVNTSNGLNTRVCSQFNWISTADVMEIDFNVVIPNDIETGIKKDTITVTATAVV